MILCIMIVAGLQCSLDVLECQSVPCLNGARCVDGENQYTCECSPGFSGRQCEHNLDESESSPCLNGSLCVDQVNSYVCQCQPAWTGQQCQVRSRAGRVHVLSLYIHTFGIREMYLCNHTIFTIL